MRLVRQTQGIYMSDDEDEHRTTRKMTHRVDALNVTVEGDTAKLSIKKRISLSLNAPWKH
jgi:hypothetical protein